MKIPPFELERNQSLWENIVEYNVSESGVHPLSLAELFTMTLKPSKRLPGASSATARQTELFD
jgi:hypothetical protein